MHMCVCICVYVYLYIHLYLCLCTSTYTVIKQGVIDAECERECGICEWR